MLGIDAARGAAMLFSCLAHYGWWIGQTQTRATGMLLSIAMVATPTFLLLSGTVTGWLICSTDNPQRTQLKLLNRGLFLLTLGHILVSLAEAHRNGLVRALSGATIVDDIGLCIICSALCFRGIRNEEFRRSLLAYGLSGYIFCWLTILIWHPPAGGWLVLHQVLLGPDPLGVSLHTYSSPTLPYMCLFAVGLGSSDYVVAAARPGASSRSRRGLLALGFALVATALLLRGVRWLAELQFQGADFLPVMISTLTISGKTPPSPAYLLFYCGAGIVMSVSFFALASSPSKLASKIATTSAVLGRASLFVFVLQYFIFWTLPDLAGITPGNTHPVLIFVAGVGLNWLAAMLWNRLGGNRLLTLGIKRGLLERRIEAAPLP